MLKHNFLFPILEEKDLLLCLNFQSINKSFFFKKKKGRIVIKGKGEGLLGKKIGFSCSFLFFEAKGRSHLT
jgi:hypothetical protein